MKHRWLIGVLSLVALAVVAMAGVRIARTSLGVCALSTTDHFGNMTSRQQAPATRKLRVLFVGNSLTFVNDLPGMLVSVASSDPQNPVQLEVGSNTIPDASLQHLYDDGCGLKRIRAETPGVVVLQEHSFFWGDPQSSSAAREALANWATAVRQAGGAPEYFEPWVNGPGDDAAFTNAGDLGPAMQSTAGLYGVPVVRVGEAFAEAVNAPGAPGLYSSDNHHASLAGTFLAALVFFHHFTGEPAERATWRPDSVSPEAAALLARIADNYS